MVHEGSKRMNLLQYSGPSCRAQSASGSKVLPLILGPAETARTKSLGAWRALGGSCFQYSSHIRDVESSAPASLLRARGENQKGNRRPAQPRAKRPRYWPYQVPGRGVPGPARVETQGGSCAGNTVHSVPGGIIGAAEGISRKNCGSGSGSPQSRHSAYIETDRFAYLIHSQPAREASPYILPKGSALQNVSYAPADQPVHSLRSPGHL
jgi:hypothetical protein